MTKPQTPAALRRKIERLEAQIAALKHFIDRDTRSEYETIMRNADMALRIRQAVGLLNGSDQ